MSYQRQDLGAPPVVTPQYERIVGGATTNVTLSNLQPGSTYRVRVWSTNGSSVSSEAREMAVTAMERGELTVYALYAYMLYMHIPQYMYINFMYMYRRLRAWDRHLSQA